jgi:hypothetical protein
MGGLSFLEVIVGRIALGAMVRVFKIVMHVMAMVKRNLKKHAIRVMVKNHIGCVCHILKNRGGSNKCFSICSINARL